MIAMYLNYFNQFVNFAVENKKELIKYYVLSLLVGILELGGVALIYPFMFKLINASSLNVKDLSLGLVIVSLFLAKNAFMIFYTKLQLAFTQKCEKYLSEKFMKFFLFGTYQCTSKISYAQKNQILNYIIPNCINNYLLRILNLSVNLMIFLLITGFLFVKFFVASIITLCCSCLILFLEIKFFQLKTKCLPDKLKENNLNIGQFSNKSMLNLKNLKIYNKETEFLAEYIGYRKERYEYNKQFQFYNTISPYVTEPLIIILLFILLAIISLQTLDKTASLVASYALIASAIFRLAPSINRIQNNMTGIKNCIPVLEDFFKYYLLYDIKNVDNILVRKKCIDFCKTIELKQIDFSYDNKKVLQNINLRINNGDFIGIVGTSGAGKTTLIDLIAGLLSPQTGEILVDNVKYEVNSSKLKIGYVPQESGYMSSTIRECVAFGSNDIDDNKVIKALKQAQLYDYINTNFDEGIYTNPFIDSIGLSQGQKQRLSIARALYTEPDILILDEATSSLDLKTEDEICEVLNNLKGEKTIIVIAHRLSTIKSADRIVFMKSGRISDVANFDELINKNNDFKTFVELSFLKNKTESHLN